MRFCIIAAVLAVLFAAATGAAQSISGTVADVRGAAVSGAEVTLESVGKTERAMTGSDGSFSFSNAPAGKLTVSASGFKTYTTEVEPENAGLLAIILQPAPVTVTVSVTRSEEDQLNASFAVITVESLGVTAARTADDTLRQIPGFQLFRRSSSRTTNPTAQGANLRGVSGSGASRTSVLFDGLSLNDAFGGWTYWSRVPMIAVEQIEIFRGGASSFYGSGGLSGAISIVPVKRNGEKFLFKAETSAASQNTGDLSLLLLASRGRWHVDLIGDVFRTGGYIPVEETSRGSVDTPAASRHGNLIFKLGRSFGGSGRVFARGDLFRERRDNGTRLTDNQTNFRRLAFGADATSQRYGELQFRAFRERQIYDQTFSAVSADRNTETLSRLQRVPSNAYGASILWRKKLPDHSLTASAELMQTRGFSDEVGYAAGIATNVSHTGGEARDLSFFIQDNWKALPKFALNLSVRIDARRNFDGITATRTISSGNVAETRFPDRSDTSFSPRIAAVYDISDAVAIYASYARSFRAPSLNELYRGFRVGNIVTEANAFLTPERASTFEAGGSYSLSNPTLILRASVYSTRVIDPVVSITTSSTPTLITRQRQNVGTTLTRGFESDMQYWPTAKLKLNAGYLFVDAKIAEFPAEPTLVGNFLPQVAKHNFTAQAKYDLGRRWNVSTQLRASSPQFEDDRNTLLLRKYFTADVRAAHKFSDAVEAFVGIENVFNSRYDIGRTPVRTVAAPRSVRVGLRVNLSKR